MKFLCYIPTAGSCSFTFFPAGRNVKLQVVVRSSDVRYVSIYRNIDIFIEYRDTILAFGCIDTLEWTV